MDNAQLINQDSGSVEYFTDPKILAKVRLLLGYIDLDPASSEQANKHVKANKYFTQDCDGLTQEWNAYTLFMNHPFSKQNNKLWIQKIVSEYNKANFRSGCCITFAATSEKWFKPLNNFAKCFLSPRTNYYLPSGEIRKGVTKGSVITYFGGNYEEFNQIFQGLGDVYLPAKWFVTI